MNVEKQNEGCIEKRRENFRRRLEIFNGVKNPRFWMYSAFNIHFLRVILFKSHFDVTLNLEKRYYDCFNLESNHKSDHKMGRSHEFLIKYINVDIKYTRLEIERSIIAHFE